MTFVEAIREVEKDKKIISYTGKVYTKNRLKPKKLSDTAYVCESITSEKERKGNWEIFNEA